MIGLRADQHAGDNGEGNRGIDDFDMRLGDMMRGERATMGKSLLDVQRELRIRASYVAAIENCDISAFDTPSFISGYVRSYSRYLGLDPDWAFRRFCDESGFRPPHGMAPAAAGPKPQRRPSDPAEALANPKALFIPQPEPFWASIEPRAIGSIMVMAALVAGLGYGGWSILQEVQKVNLTPSDESPSAIASLDPVQEMRAPDGSADTATALLPPPEALDRVWQPQALDVPVLTPRDGPIAAIDPGPITPTDPTGDESGMRQVAAAPVANPNAAPTAGTVAAGAGSALPGSPALNLPPIGARYADAAAPGAAPAQAGADGQVRTVAPDAPEIEILAARPAWVRVTSADGTVLLEKTMDAGERFALPRLEQPPVLRAGNSGAVYFAVNGQTYGPAASGVQVIKKLELSPAALTQKYAVADLSKDPELAQMVAVASAAPLGQGAPVDGVVPATPPATALPSGLSSVTAPPARAPSP